MLDTFIYIYTYIVEAVIFFLFYIFFFLAAGHQQLEEPVNQSLNEVIKEVFRDESLVPNEQHGFDTLALNNDLQLYRGPKQMMLN